MNDLPLRCRLYFAWPAVLGGVGVLWGGIRGADDMPTLPVALVEGGLIFGIPAALIGGVVMRALSAWRGARRVER